MVWSMYPGLQVQFAACHALGGHPQQGLSLSAFDVWGNLHRCKHQASDSLCSQPQPTHHLQTSRLSKSLAAT